MREHNIPSFLYKKLLPYAVCEIKRLESVDFLREKNQPWTKYLLNHPFLEKTKKYNV